MAASAVAVDPTAPTPSTRRVFCEAELWLLALLAVAIYFAPLTKLSIRGEESRWAQVAHEMLLTGDFVVPRQQGKPFPDRPPLNSWAMVAATYVLGGWSLAAVRLPAVLATLLTTLLIYVYGRQFLSRSAALAAGAAYATMLQVLQLGRLAESDALLTLCVSSSLLAWHTGYVRRWPYGLGWVAGYALAAAAGLAKGPQGPVYFVAATWAYLVWKRDWRSLFAVRQLAGIAVLLLIIASWQLPFYRALGWDEVRAVWSEGSTFGARFDYSNWKTVAGHYLRYPLEVLGCMLPWSLLLVVFISRRCRQELGSARPMVGFLCVACLVTLPSCWLPVDSRPRYYMSLYPCAALLVGAAAERIWQTSAASWWQPAWSRYLTASVGGMLLAAGACVAAASGCPGLERLNVAPLAAVATGAACVALAIAAWLSRHGTRPAQLRLGVLSVAAFWGLAYAELAIDAMVKTSNLPAAEIARVKQQLDGRGRLVSFGSIHHLFAYYFQDPIEYRRWPTDAANHADVEYFCFSQTKGQPRELPFAWTPLAEISCDRNRRADPNDRVVIGRRLATDAGMSRSTAERERQRR